MASQPHRFHPDPEKKDDPDAILWDDCPACYENGSHPEKFLDRVNIQRLEDRVVAVIRGEDRFRTPYEAGAAAVLLLQRGSENLAPIDSM